MTHVQALCLLNHGYSEKLHEMYIEVAHANHESQKELVRTKDWGETAATKRQRLQQEIWNLQGSHSGARVADLQRHESMVTRIIGVGRDGGHRDRVAAAE